MILPENLSWPTWQWWSHLKGTDQAIWLSGIGTLSAAVVALAIAVFQFISQKCERKKLTSDRNYNCALFLMPIFSTLAAVADAVAVRISDMSDSQKCTEVDIRLQCRMLTFEAAGRLTPVALTLSPKLATRVVTTLSWCNQFTEAMNMCFTRHDADGTISLFPGGLAKKQLLLALSVIQHYGPLAANDMDLIIQKRLAEPNDLLTAQQLKIEATKARMKLG